MNVPLNVPIRSPRHDSLTKMRIAHPARVVSPWGFLGNGFDVFFQDPDIFETKILRIRKVKRKVYLEVHHDVKQHIRCLHTLHTSHGAHFQRTSLLILVII